MKIALTQFAVSWENIDENKIQSEKLIKEAKENGADIIGFPEFTLVGFSGTPEKFSDKPGNMEQLDFFKEMSEKYDIGIVFGYIQEHSPHPLNKLAIVENGKVILDYAKLHSYSFGKENLFYDRGDKIYTADFKGINVGAHICFDLRFPEIFQKSSKTAYIIFVIANWPGDRIENWYTLLRARALENQSYIVGINRWGSGGGIDFVNSSVAYDPAGNRVTEESEASIVYFEAKKEVVEEVRKSFPLKADRRDSLYKNLY